MDALSDPGLVRTPSPVLPAAQPASAQKTSRGRQTSTAWTRSGCLTCKRRRKGCDKAKPSCNNCLKQGRKCEGYGSMWVEPLGPSAQVFKVEGSKRRRLSASSPSISYSDPWLGLQRSPGSATPPGWSEPSTPQGLNGDPEIEIVSPTPDMGDHLSNTLAMTPRPQGYINHLSEHELHYLQYHMEEGSRLLANLESDGNPLRSILIPRALSSPLLMKAVCAVSALHLANRSQGLRAQTAAANFYGGTLRGIRTALVERPTDLLPDDAMLAVGLLCKYEIVRGSVTQWSVHLDALQRLLVSRGGFASMDRDAAEFLRGLFVYAHSMAQITNRKRITSADASPVDDDIGIPRLDIYIGYTEELLKTCGRISQLQYLKDDILALPLAVASINETLTTWSHTSARCITPPGLTAANLTRLQLVAECFRDAAFIHLHSILERMITHRNDSYDIASIDDRDNTTPSHLPNQLIDLISTPKATAVHRCLSRVESLHLDHHCEYSALTFPLFIAGCESTTAVQREVVTQSLDKLQDNFGIGNVRRAKELLASLWMRRDAEDPDGPSNHVHWLDVLEELGWELILA
ncbi:hypothetical protein N7474_003083 [Penicillium riverlandense]|uniref:uncharacterized protein n=1 Tax=Penicillium riverlandense TaxID=1903569 RepID=UPI0025479F50|nr:uncharacterized protein N7474_003083 [Penicillium riverlandense]KAJ5825945.1 hypothetical protein N7474_003083 [Penicillium riverlandense]